jgi:hypothetical protein
MLPPNRSCESEITEFRDISIIQSDSITVLRFKVPRAMKIKAMVVWDVTSYISMEFYEYLVGSICILFFQTIRTNERTTRPLSRRQENLFCCCCCCYFDEQFSLFYYFTSVYRFLKSCGITSNVAWKMFCNEYERTTQELARMNDRNHKNSTGQLVIRSRIETCNS